MNEYKTGDDELNRYVEESYRLYSEAVLSFPNNDPPEEYKGNCFISISKCRVISRICIFNDLPPMYFE